MSAALRWIFLCAVAIAECAATVRAADIEHIVFESGSVGPSGSHAASGWEFLSTNIGADPDEARATIENVPNRTFQTGTNQEAMVLHPWFTTTGPAFGHGAEWNVANDPAASVRTIQAGDIVYLQMEIFSDIAGGGQFFKLASAVGFRGNGSDPSVNRGFNDEGALGDNDKNMLTSIEADWTFDTALNFNGIIKNSDRAEKRNSTRYLNPPLPEELEKTYVSTAIFRQGIDAASPFIGTETEVSEVLDNQNGGESSATGTSAPTEPWGGNTNVITGMVLDRAQVNVLRGSNNVPGGVTRVSEHVSFVDPFEEDPQAPTYMGNAVLGIKMFRFGIADRTDVNLDGVTDERDRAIVLANQGLWPDGNGNGATFFEGDLDNDLDVDADDFAFFGTGGDLNGDGSVDGVDLLIGQREANFDDFFADWELNFGTTAGSPNATAVPEPATALLGGGGALALACSLRRSPTKRRR